MIASLPQNDKKRRARNDYILPYLSLDHGYSFCRAYLHAYSTSFAVFEIYLDGYCFLDDGIWAVKPAQKTCRLLLFGWDALVMMYHRHKAAPLARLAGFADSWRRFITDMLAISGSHGLVLSYSLQFGYLVGFGNCGKVNIYSVIGNSFSYYFFYACQIYNLGSAGKCA